MDLTEFILVLGNRVTRAVKDDEAGTGGALVDGTYETVLEVVVAAIFILDNRATAITRLVGIHVNLGDIFLVQVFFDLGHVKRVLHFGHVYGESGCRKQREGNPR